MQERQFRLALPVLGHGVFLSLLGLAWKYAVMRTTFGDTAFQVFQWISQPGWDIEAHRYTAIVPQAAVKFFALFGPDLTTLLTIASLAHVLVGYGVFVVCAHVWKSPIAAFGCALASVLCSRLAFYSPVLEANYLLSYPFLFVGYLEHRAPAKHLTPQGLVVATVLALAALIVHPAGWMVMLFAAVFMPVSGLLPLRSVIPFAALFASWPLISRWVFPPTGYELEQYASVTSGLGDLAHFTQWGSWRFLTIHVFSASTTYLPALLVSVVVVAGWAFLRSGRVAVLTLLGVLGFVGVYLITFHGGNSAVMQDRGLLPVATIISLSAAALIPRLGSRRWRTLALVLAAIVLFVKTRDVSFASRPFLKHLSAQEELIRLAGEQEIPRGIVDCDRLSEEGIDVSWAFPVETLLRSTVISGARQCVLVCSDALPAPHMLASGQVQVLQFAWAVDKNGNRYFEPSDAPYATVRQR